MVSRRFRIRVVSDAAALESPIGDIRRDGIIMRIDVLWIWKLSAYNSTGSTSI